MFVKQTYEYKIIYFFKCWQYIMLILNIETAIPSSKVMGETPKYKV